MWSIQRRREYHREYMRRYRGTVIRPPQVLTCAYCHKEQVLKWRRARRRYCSYECYRLGKRALNSESDFWLKVDQSGGPNACWPWLGKKSGRWQRGQCNYFGRTENASRVAWILHFKQQPVHQVLHCCPDGEYGNCCNPRHMYDGTSLDNAIDRAKLTTVQVRVLRVLNSRFGYRGKLLAQLFDVSYAHVWRILNNRCSLVRENIK